MIHLEIKPPFAQVFSGNDLLEQAAGETLHHLNQKPETSLSILVTDNQEIQSFNHQYRDVDAPTDVLSFPAGYTDPDTGEFYVGDIILSYPKAKTQAEDRGHTVEEELQVLVVHGVLHLLGYDHETPQEKKVMWQHQDTILKAIGLEIEME